MTGALLARVRFRVLFAFVALASCGQAPPPAPSPIPPPVAAPPADGAEAPFGTLDLATLPGSIALYDPEHWRVGAGGTFTVLEHATTRSTLTLRVWRASRLVRPAECETEARLARPALPRPDPELLVDSRALEVPSGFHGSLVVGVEPHLPGGARGHALGVGAAVGRCFLLAFETVADGADAAHVVGDRLRILVDRIVPSVTLREADERVQPERALK
ncbi:MAG TPA: hypothetical protein VFZ53_17550 [Polyangiaceae bacterium]